MRATSLTGGQIADGVLLAAIARILFTSVAYWITLLVFGAVEPITALTLIPLSVFAGACWAATTMAITARVKDDDGFLSLFNRLFVLPMFLFSGTFYPLDALPLAIQWIGWISPLWHATILGRWLSYGADTPGWLLVTSLLYLLALGIVGRHLARRAFEGRLTA